jgi:hypothetical protein
MPSFNTKLPPYQAGKKVQPEWNTWRKGLNLLLRPTELKREEMAQADNILLEGSGVPTGRWGSSVYFTAGTNGRVRGLGTFNQDAFNDVLALTDDGYLVKKNGVSFTQINGASWPSGTTVRFEQLGGETYVVSEDVSLVSYDGTDLSVYATISAPTGVYASNISGVAGPARYSYKVVANSINGGHTQPSTNYVISNVPSDLTLTTIQLWWSAPSAATLSGYEIYRGLQGDETFLTAVDASTLSYRDLGADSAATITPPLTNTTGGVKSPLIKRYQNRLLMVDKDNPSTLLISAKYPDHTSFSLMDGGGSVDIEPDSGDDIVAIEVQPIADRIVVYKNNSSYLVKLDFVTVGPFYLLDPSYIPISTSLGCSSPDTVATVENDTFYFGRDGIYVTGYEPNFLNIIRTNEVSARIRPYFDKLGEEDYATACAFYVDHKYILSFPRLKQCVVYDRERGCFAGVWTLPYGLTKLMKYVDSTGTERWIIGSNEDTTVYEFITSVNNDNGTAIVKTLRTNKEDFGDWTKLSILEYFYILFRAITGTVTVNIIVEDRDGTNYNAKTFTITGSETAGLSGWGVDLWGTAQYGLSNSTDYSVSVDELTRWGTVFKQVRQVQTEVTSTSTDSNWELLKITMKAKPQSSGVLSSSQRV